MPSSVVVVCEFYWNRKEGLGSSFIFRLSHTCTNNFGEGQPASIPSSSSSSSRKKIHLFSHLLSKTALTANTCVCVCVCVCVQCIQTSSGELCPPPGTGYKPARQGACPGWAATSWGAEGWEWRHTPGVELIRGDKALANADSFDQSAGFPMLLSTDGTQTIMDKSRSNGAAWLLCQGREGRRSEGREGGREVGDSIFKDSLWIFSFA